MNRTRFDAHIIVPAAAAHASGIVMPIYNDWQNQPLILPIADTRKLTSQKTCIYMFMVKQSPNGNVPLVRLPCMCATMRRATRAVSRLYEDELRQAGLRGTQYSLLRTLHDMETGHPGGVTQGVLADLVAMDQTTLTRNLRPLVRRGWIIIRPGETDRRERILRLSRAGKAKVDQAHAHWQAGQRRFAASMRPAEWKALGELLSAVTAAALNA
jgi:DNA-binding MarR family transcriptional regulator